MKLNNKSVTMLCAAIVLAAIIPQLTSAEDKMHTRNDITIEAISSPEPGKAGTLGFAFETEWMKGKASLRTPETLHSSLGLHFIDHYREDMLPLDNFEDHPAWIRERSTGALAYEHRTKEGLLYGATVTKDDVGININFYATNLTDKKIERVFSQMCLNLHGAEELDETFTLEPMYTWIDGEFKALSTTTPTPAEKGLNPWILMLTKDNKDLYKGPREIENAWWVVNELADYNIIVRKTEDGKHFLAVAWDETESVLMSNTKIPCLHAGPQRQEDLEPSESASWRGKIFLLPSDPDLLLQEYLKWKATWEPKITGEAKTLRMGAIRVVWPIDGSEPVDVTIERGFDLVRDAARQGAEYVVLPENFLHSNTPEDQVIPGPLTNRLVDLAKELDIYICSGIIESFKFDFRDYYDTYLSSVLVGPEGVISVHRKVDIVMADYAPYYYEGMPKTDLNVWNGQDFAMHKAGEIDRIGMMICRDMNTNWAWTRVMSQDPQVIFSPNLRDSIMIYGGDFRSMSEKYGVPVVACSGHPDSETVIVDRDGMIVGLETKVERAVVADVTLAKDHPEYKTFDVIQNTYYMNPANYENTDDE